MGQKVDYVEYTCRYGYWDIPRIS